MITLNEMIIFKKKLLKLRKRIEKKRVNNKLSMIKVYKEWKILETKIDIKFNKINLKTKL